MPLITRPQVYRVVRELLPRERFGPEELLLWLDGVQQRNERARQSHEKRRAVLGRDASGLPPYTVVVILDAYVELSKWAGKSSRTGV